MTANMPAEFRMHALLTFDPGSDANPPPTAPSAEIERSVIADDDHGTSPHDCASAPDVIIKKQVEKLAAGKALELITQRRKDMKHELPHMEVDSKHVS